MAKNTTNPASRRSGRVLFLLGLLFAVVAAILVFVAINQSDEKKEVSAAPVATTAVVVASRDIPARTELTADMVKLADLPDEQVLRGTFDETQSLVGQITRQPILLNEQITAGKVGPQTKAERNEGLSFVVPAGKRAFSISVSEVSAVGGLLLPGDLVDVIAVFNEGDVDVDKAVTLLQNIEVLAVAQEAQESIPPPVSAAEDANSDGTGEETALQGDARGARPEDAAPNPSARTVTLAVTLDQAQILALTQARGELALALRPFGDAGEVAVGETTLIPVGARPSSP